MDYQRSVKNYVMKSETLEAIQKEKEQMMVEQKPQSGAWLMAFIAPPSNLYKVDKEL